jgi:UDP:flavonoid glycosyltransferase YjiC (YdhE family)
MWSAIDASIGSTITPELNRFRTELGLAPVRRPLRRWIYSPDLVIGLFPEWFGPPQPDWPPNTLLAGFSLFDESGFRQAPPELESFLGAGAPPIVFTRGSHSRQAEARAFFETSVEIARRLGRRAVLLARERDSMPGTLPEGVAYFGFVPLSRILPRAAALVHHGGVGTAAQAFAAGIPQLAVPLADDQPDNAARIERLGAGLRLPARMYQPATVVRELKRLLDSAEVAATCGRLAAAVGARDSLGIACDAIEAMLSREPGPSPTAASMHAGSRPTPPR